MSSILEQFKKQVEIDRQEENYDLSDNEQIKDLTDEEYEEYKQTIDNIREQMYEEVPKEMSTRVENKSYPNDLVEEYENTKKSFSTIHRENMDVTEKFETLNYVKLGIVKAYCPFCGEEIVTTTPTTYNPITHESMVGYECKKCGNMYTVKKSYPRAVILDENNNKVNVHFD